MFSDFFSLVFPNTCTSCKEYLYKGESFLCTRCKYNLPKTNYHLEYENPLMKRFWGKVPVSYALSYLKFIKGGSVQKILYSIKYEGMKDGAKTLGNWFGLDLNKEGYDKKFDLILPVPMHKKKIKIRGYNQSDFFAEGLSEAMNVNYSPVIFERVSESTSQTKKNRFERWLNVKDIYKLKEPEAVIDKHVLLADDVITTGATFEACARELLDKGAREVSIVAIASAQ
jgi:ComF family protein